MVSSAIPISGDLFLNANTALTGFEQNNDSVYVWDTSLSPANYDTASAYSTKHANWGGVDPTTASVTQGFWYYVAGTGTEKWIENLTIN